MKKLFYIFFCFLLAFKLYALDYDGPIEKISSPIKIEYKLFNGSLKGSTTLEYNFQELYKGSQSTKATLTTKKIGSGENIIAEYILEQGQWDYDLKLIIYITPQGKVIRYYLELGDPFGQWQKIRKSEIKYPLKDTIKILIDTIIQKYNSSFSVGDVVFQYPFNKIAELFLKTSEIDPQITNNFNLLDSIPNVVDSKLIGETCHKGRSAYLLQYDVYHKYNKQPSESTFKFEGYQLIDKETGFYFYGKTKGLWFIDYGKVLDDGTKRFEYIANETFDYSFDKSNCSTKKITKSKSTNATQKTTSNNKNNTNKLVKEKLLELKKLFDEGLITKDVYEKKQLELLE